MTEDYGGGTAAPATIASAENIPHGVLADMGEVNYHAHAVHFVDDGTAVGAYAAPVRGGLFHTAASWCGECGIGVLVVAVVGECCVSDAEVKVVAEVG